MWHIRSHSLCHEKILSKCSKFSIGHDAITSNSQQGQVGASGNFQHLVVGRQAGRVRRCNARDGVMHLRRFNASKFHDAAAPKLKKARNSGRASGDNGTISYGYEDLIIGDKGGIKATAFRLGQETEGELAFTAAGWADEKKAGLADDDGGTMKIGWLNAHARSSLREARG